jgi:hypothetical protein
MRSNKSGFAILRSGFLALLTMTLLGCGGNGTSSNPGTGPGPGPAPTPDYKTLTLVSLDANGNPVPATGNTYEDLPSVSQNGRYLGFTHYLRDTCIGVSGACTPKTITFAPLTDQRGESMNYRQPDNSGGHVVYGYFEPTIESHSTVEYADTCFLSSGCTPSNQELLSAQIFPKATMTPDGRYVAYTTGGAILEKPWTPYIYDTCTGASSGCTPSTLQVSSQVALSAARMSANARYIVYDKGKLGDLRPSFVPSMVNLHDSCIGAPAGCTPSDATISDTTLNCSGSAITTDAQYITYSCSAVSGGTESAYIAATCLGVSNCSPTTSNEPFLSIAAVSIGNRYQLVSSTDSTTRYNMVSVFDTCNGASAGCVSHSAPLCVTANGASANADCYSVGMTPDGKYLYVYSAATNLPGGGGTYAILNPLL